MKLCINCRHYQAADQHSDPANKAEYALCLTSPRKLSERLDLVDGREKPPKFNYCALERATGICGEDGAKFEQAAEVVTP